MSNHSVQTHLATAEAEASQAIASFDNPPAGVKSPDDRWYVMACIRACGGDHTAGLVLSQLLYWWPKKRAGQKGVKKSVSDWEAELMLGEKPTKRINKVLTRLEFVEIYKAPWGHYQSDSTFYVLTPKALALLKAPLPKVQVVSEAPAPTEGMVSKAPLPTGGVVSKAPLPTGVITENTYNPTEKEKTKAVDEKPSTFPSNSKEQSGKNKATPKEPLTMFNVWKENTQKHFPDSYLEPKATDIKNLAPKMRRLYKSGLTDYLAFLEWVTTYDGFLKVRYEWAEIWNGEVNKLDAPPAWPDLHFLLDERNLAVSVAIYRHMTKQSAEAAESPATPLADLDVNNHMPEAVQPAVEPAVIDTRLSIAAAWELIERSSALICQISIWRDRIAAGVPTPALEQYLANHSAFTPEKLEIALVLMPPIEAAESPAMPLADLDVNKDKADAVEPVTEAVAEAPATVLTDVDDERREATPDEIRAWFKSQMEKAKAAAAKPKPKVTADSNFQWKPKTKMAA